MVRNAGNFGAGGTSGYAAPTEPFVTGNQGSLQITSPGKSFNIISTDLWAAAVTGTAPNFSFRATNCTITFTGTKADGSGTITHTAAITPSGTNVHSTVLFAGSPFDGVQLSAISFSTPTGIQYLQIDNFKYGTATLTNTQLSIDDVSVIEGTGAGTTTATFTVSRTNNTTAFTVNLASSDGTATAGTDYTAFPSTALTFASGGALTQTVNVTISKDAVIEQNETFNMTLSSATNGTVYLKQTGIGTILNDDSVIETFETETNNATTFSESGVSFASSGGYAVKQASTFGSGSSAFFLSSTNNAVGNQGTFSITTANRAFKLNALDAWVGTTATSHSSGSVTFTGTLFGGGTVTTTKTITATAATGAGWQQNITFVGTPLDNVLLTGIQVTTAGALTECDIDNFNFTVVSTLPIIEVFDASNNAITNGGAAATANNTDFGSVCVSTGTISKTYTIKNSGNSNLTLSGSPLAVLGGADAGQFSITTQPTSPITAAGSVTFTVQFDPSSAGVKNATLTLTNNDATNSPYVLNIKGTGNPDVAIPSFSIGASTLCPGGTSTYTASASNSNSIVYSILNGSGATINSSTGVVSAVTGDFTVVATASGTCGSNTIANRVVTVTLNVGTPSFTNPTTALCSGQTATYTATASNASSIIYSILNGTGATIDSVTGAVSALTGNFTVVATASGTCGANTTANQAVTFTTTPTAPVANAQIFCGSKVVDDLRPRQGATIKWYNLPTGGSALLSITAISTGNYYVSEINAAGCESPRTMVAVTVNPLPATPIITGGNVSLCQDNTVTLSISNFDPNITYVWQKALATGTNDTYTTFGGSTATQVVSSSGLYRVTATNNTNCSIFSEVVPVTLSDYFFNGAIDTTDASQSGRMTRNGTASTCSAPKSYPGNFTTTGARLYDSYTIANPRNVAVCATIGVTSGCGINLFTATYLGSFNPANVGQNYLADIGSSFPTAAFYSVTVPANATIVVVVHTLNENQTCASYTLSVELPREAAGITVTPTTPVCAGSAVTLTSSLANTYAWTGGGTFATQSINPTVSANTTYDVTLGYGNRSCTATAQAVINPIITAAPTAVSNQTFCNGETLANIVVTGTGIVWYNAATAGTSLLASTLIQSGTTYYAAQIGNSCESTSRQAITMTSGTCLGNENFDASTFSYYPNPTTGIVYLSYGQPIEKITVSNVLGQVILENTNNTNEAEIDLSSFAGGTYLFKIISNSQVKIIKVVKN